MRPVATVAFPSYLFLALGPRSAVEARRVTIRGCNTIVSPEPAMPWPCAAMLVANLGSHANSIN